MKITQTSCEFEREPLVSPFGFKGGWLSELWQTIIGISGRDSHQRIGLGVQSVLWSDAQVFSSYPESVGNSQMFLMTAFAAEQAKQIEWDTPLELLDKLLPATFQHGRTFTSISHLRLTFALNAMVPLDSAAWLLYCDKNGITNFDALIPASTKAALSARHDKLACIPLITYGTTIEDIVRAVDDGYFFLKIKIGADPDADGDLDKMLAWDMQRLTEIHKAIGSKRTPYTDTGKIAYYLDSNGRYDRIDRLMKLVKHAEKIGAADQILILEEPFPEHSRIDVSEVPVCIAADECAHNEEDCLDRISLGYKAMALKPIAKTLSMTLRIAELAYQHDVACFCADLTVNPVMVDWNKNVAARLKPLPGLKIGVLETNGSQYYRNWEKMKTYHPYCKASWTEPADGIFTLDDDFYTKSGGIFETPTHYEAILNSANQT